MSDVGRGRLTGRRVGRYVIHGEIAAGGMAAVHFGRLHGSVGFSRTVAIKRLHPQFAKDPEFVTMFLDEARVAARVQHPNVVAPVDVVAEAGELLLVMEYVPGETLARLMRISCSNREPVAPGVIATILVGVLQGLHAAHEAVSEHGEPLGIVHRDVSPQNIIVGRDGVARILDFGVAKAATRAASTRHGQLKGKLGYMAPEQLRGGNLDRRADIFAAGVVLWEALTGRRLFRSDSDGETMGKLLMLEVAPPSRHNSAITPAVNELVLRALERDPEARYQTADEFARILEQIVPLATAREVGEWVGRAAADVLHERAETVAEIESSPSSPSNPIPALYMDPIVGTQRALPTSSPSTLTVTREISFVQKLRRPPWVLLAACFGLAVAMGLAAASGFSAEDAGPTPTARSLAVAAPAGTPIETLDEPPASIAKPKTLPISDEADTPGSADADVHEAETSKRGARNAVRMNAAALTPSRITAPAKAGCSVPYYLDSKGIRRVRPECL